MGRNKRFNPNKKSYPRRVHAIIKHNKQQRDGGDGAIGGNTNLERNRQSLSSRRPNKKQEAMGVNSPSDSDALQA